MVKLEQMTKKTYGKFIKKSIKRFAKSLVKSGFYDKNDALVSAKKMYAGNIDKDFKNSKFDLYIIKNEKDKKIGYLWLAKEKRLLFIREIYIRKKYRYQGYGSDLMEKIDSIAKVLQVKRIGLAVMNHNDIAKALYEKAGVGVISEYRMKKV